MHVCSFFSPCNVLGKRMNTHALRSSKLPHTLSLLVSSLSSRPLSLSPTHPLHHRLAFIISQPPHTGLSKYAVALRPQTQPPFHSPARFSSTSPQAMLKRLWSAFFGGEPQAAQDQQGTDTADAHEPTNKRAKAVLSEASPATATTATAAPPQAVGLISAKDIAAAEAQAAAELKAELAAGVDVPDVGKPKAINKKHRKPDAHWVSKKSREYLELKNPELATGQEIIGARRESHRREEDGQRPRKSVILLGYNGNGYFGMQRNRGYETIEEELFKALLKTKLIPKEGYAQPQRIGFQRTARTDKNVHAARQLVSLKMYVEEDMEAKLNAHLPPEIRVFWVARATQGFNCKRQCSGRRYEYLLPTYALCPKEQTPRHDYRVTAERLATFNTVLKQYEGTHRFHNYTSGRPMSDPSVSRFIKSFKALPPFEHDGLEWIQVQVEGQSFMLHQIRKMIGMAVAVTRGYAEMKHVFLSFNKAHVDVPKIPGIGLLLDCPLFDNYNKKFKDSHPPLTFEDQFEVAEAFKREHIINGILETEKNDAVIRSWLSRLHHHKYHPYNSATQAKEEQEREGQEQAQADGEAAGAAADQA
eukprot:m.231666 g.231666  ORF g.231666 m.231666 type:complete len:588 (+) comp15221_c0_seq4:2-1765(+)